MHLAVLVNTWSWLLVVKACQAFLVNSAEVSSIDPLRKYGRSLIEDLSFDKEGGYNPVIM